MILVTSRGRRKRQRRQKLEEQKWVAQNGRAVRVCLNDRRAVPSTPPDRCKALLASFPLDACPVSEPGSRLA